LAIQQQHFWYSLKNQHLLSVFNFGDNSAASAQLPSASVSVAAAHILQFSNSISSTRRHWLHDAQLCSSNIGRRGSVSSGFSGERQRL
jgi:hypothetical protein